jgi:hypothetical protein
MTLFSNFNGHNVANGPYGGVNNPANVIIITTGAPSTAATDNPIGTIAINASTGVCYICVKNTGINGTVTWDQLGLATGTVGQLTGDTGTALPTAGSIQIKGTANQITTTGSASQVALTLPAAITTPGSLLTTTSLAATTTVTAGTGVTATTGGVTAAAGNIVATLGNITSSAGSVSAATTVTAGTGLTVTTGNATVSTGNIVATLGSITAGAAVIGLDLVATGDPGAGTAATNIMSNVNSTTISTGVGSVKMSTANAATNTGWLKCYIGTQVAWIPTWTTNAP